MMTPPLRAIAPLLVVFAATGCNVIAGLDDLKYEGGGETGQGGQHEGGHSNSTTSGTAAGGAGENCANGADDDNDSQVDCEDPDCGEFKCVEVPPGWEGPVVLREGAFSESDACGGFWVEERYLGVDGFMPPEAACTPCDCAPESVTCTPKPIQTFATQQCGGPKSNIPVVIGACTSLNDGEDGFVVQPPTEQVGPCVPGGGNVDPTPHTWSAEGRLCGANGVGAGCDSAGACVPETDGAICVLHAGETPCPPGFPEQHLFFDDPSAVDDSRDCTPCNCGDPLGSCFFSTKVYSDSACSTELGFVLHDGSCFGVTNGATLLTTATPAFSCGSNGGDPTGGVVPQSGSPRTTVCCE